MLQSLYNHTVLEFKLYYCDNLKSNAETYWTTLKSFVFDFNFWIISRLQGQFHILQAQRQNM